MGVNSSVVMGVSISFGELSDRGIDFTAFIEDYGGVVDSVIDDESSHVVIGKIIIETQSGSEIGIVDLEPLLPDKKEIAGILRQTGIQVEDDEIRLYWVNNWGEGSER